MSKAEKFCSMGLVIDHLPVVPVHGNGLNLRLDQIDSLGLLRGPFETAEVALVSELVKPGHVVVDVGANIGYYTLLFSRLVGDAGKVIAFEPDQNNAALLLRNLADNGCWNVKVHQVATSAHKTMLRLYKCAVNNGMHRTYDSICCTTNYQSITAVPLDLVLEGEPRIDFIKMDIEGYEFFALQGMQKLLVEHLPKILVEFSPFALIEAGVTATAFINFFIKHDYVISSVTPKPEVHLVRREVPDLLQRAAVFDSHADILRQQMRCESEAEFRQVLDTLFDKMGRPFEILDSWVCEKYG